MRILAFSDSHENAVAVEAFLKRISSIDFVPDVFVSAGDIGPRSMVRILQALSAMDRPILYVWGNHILHYPPRPLRNASMNSQQSPKRSPWEIGMFRSGVGPSSARTPGPTSWTTRAIPKGTTTFAGKPMASSRIQPYW